MSNYKTSKSPVQRTTTLLERRKEAELRAEKYRKRTERNKSRTIKYTQKLFGVYRSAILEKYTHISWSEGGSALRQLSPFLVLEEYNELGEMWSEAWTGTVESVRVNELLNKIGSRLEMQTDYSRPSAYGTYNKSPRY